MTFNRHSRSAGPKAALFLLFVVLAAWAGSVAADTYLVISLIGDRLTVVTQGSQTGTHLDGNSYDVIPLAGTDFDDLVVSTASAAIERTRPHARVTMLRITNPALYALAASWRSADPPDIRAVLPGLAPFAPGAPGTRLVLIAPYRDVPQMHAYNSYRGTGSVAGVGFYVGSGSVERAVAPGYLGAFANVQLIVADAASGAIETRQSFTIGTTHSVAKSADGTVWNAIPMSEKVPALESLVRGEVDRRVPLMLSSSAP
jgi:hypothetical protein